MSLDIVFQPCRSTGTPVVRKNPFTGVDQTVTPNEPLNSTEQKAVERVFKEVGAQGPDEFGFYVIEWKGGGATEIDCSDLQNGCTVTLRGDGNGLFDFLFDLLKSAEWVMIPAMEDLVAITNSSAGATGFPKSFAKVIECHSPRELEALLSGGIRQSENYRRQVIDEE